MPHDVKTSLTNSDEDPHRRSFSAILEAIKPVCRTYVVDYKNHRALGILHLPCGGHFATIQYRPQWGYLSVTADLDPSTALAVSRIMVVSPPWGNSEFVTHLVDREDGRAWAEAATLLCPRCRDPGAIAEQLFRVLASGGSLHRLP